MTKNKLSPLEQLRIRKAQLWEEMDIHKGNMAYSWDYAKAHFGKLLLGSTVLSSKNGFLDVFSGLTGKTANKTGKSSSATNVVTSIAPLVWNIVQPLLLELLVKKVKSLFRSKKKKKVKK